MAKINGITDYIEARPDSDGSVRIVIGNNTTDDENYIDLSLAASVDFGTELAAATITASGFPVTAEEIKLLVMFRSEEKDAEVRAAGFVPEDEKNGLLS